MADVAERIAQVTTSGGGDASPDRTATGKPHFEVLDGLRGVAALLVVLFHIQGITVNWDGAKVFFHHAPLAVDFFFALSGFVIGYAYDDRWPRMTAGRFFALRLIRLHPMVIVGTLLGFASYILDPYAGAAQVVSSGALLMALVLGLLALPSGSLPNRWTDTHPLNGPCWSLFQEYLGNIAYALVLRRLPTCVLGLLAALSAVVLAVCAVHFGTLDCGSGWDHLWMAPVRLSFPFLTGLWLYRVRDRLPRVSLGYLPLTILLIAIVVFPTLPEIGGFKLNGAYEALCVILLFPAIIVAGAHSDAGRGLMGLCKASGRLSYPIYITHFPFLYVWMNYVANAHHSPQRMLVIGAALVPFLLLVAWVALTVWDEPVRARLRAALRRG
ncbi:acyltransferase family protein [Sphingomonas sp. PR090111-T3T-6A]|uniref:acyltransferase family protein n=1 Tax=Sphingomonas sp. PR090111-T3T-6A TaxID=685778 RepID=UPI00037CA8D8|nr:acyltransferase [Sphingomonas sp. PR090111-T3T-6A]